jgi:hypothetical protein
MKSSTAQRLIMDAAIDGAVIRGTLTGPSGDSRDFHGWLELNTALEAILDTGGAVCAFDARSPKAGREVGLGTG